jgi:hypothetical protein
MTWKRLAEEDPALSEFGRQRIGRRISYLATIRKDGSPRVHPVSPFFMDDELFVHMEPTSPKRHDLLRDPRYAMHCAVEDNEGGLGEFVVRGEATEVNDPDTRAKGFETAKAMGHNPRERYVLFHLGNSESVSTVYEGNEIKRNRWVRPPDV